MEIIFFILVIAVILNAYDQFYPEKKQQREYLKSVKDVNFNKDRKK